MNAVKQITNSLKKYHFLLIVIFCFSILGSYYLLMSHASSTTIYWPFSSKNKSQYNRIDQGWDIQDDPSARIYAIASGTLYKSNSDPGGFGNNYPTEHLDQSIGGPTNYVYYGHVHILDGLDGKHVSAGQFIAVANSCPTGDSCVQNGSAAPSGWLEIGFANSANGDPHDSGSQPTTSGTIMHDILIQPAVQPYGGAPPAPPPPTHPAQNIGNRLTIGTRMDTTQYLQSSNGAYRAFFKPNGEFIVQDTSDGSVIWSSHTGNISPGNIKVGADGSVHIYDSSNIQKWSTHTDGSGSNNWLTLQIDGNLVLYYQNYYATWSSKGSRAPIIARAAAINVPVLTNCSWSRLSAGQYLTPNSCLFSPDGYYEMLYASNGDLEVTDGYQILWKINTTTLHPGNIKMQTDGNLVNYDSYGNVLWSTGTSNTGSLNHLKMQNDGNLVVYTSVNQTVWSWQTGKITPPLINLGTTLHVNQTLVPNEGLVASNFYSLILQLDGNLVAYNPSGGTNCNSITFPCSWRNAIPGNLKMQDDGNLVFYNFVGQVIWSSKTQGTGSNNYFVVQPDGNFAVYNSYNQVVWSKNTGRLYPVPPPPPPTNIGTQLNTNQVLWPNQMLVDNGYALIYQLDGNLVEYNPSNVAVWNSGTYGRSLGNLKMQSDGNLVLYNDYGGAMWFTSTNGKGDHDFFVLGGDGNMVVESNQSIPVWGLYQGGYIPEYPPNFWHPQPSSTLFSHQLLYPNQSITTSGYRLTYQADGNLVEYNSAGNWVWQTYTYGRSTNNLKMQDDGNLVLYNDYGGVLWSTGTAGTGGANYLIVQPDGNLVVYTASGVPVWHRW